MLKILRIKILWILNLIDSRGIYSSWILSFCGDEGLNSYFIPYKLMWHFEMYSTQNNMYWIIIKYKRTRVGLKKLSRDLCGVLEKIPMECWARGAFLSLWRCWGHAQQGIRCVPNTQKLIGSTRYVWTQWVLGMHTQHPKLIGYNYYVGTQ
jgi:hypothetical protein